MRILSKYKDYYDYLVGIYGIDDNTVLDRRSSGTFKPYISSNYFGSKVQVFICDIVYEGYYTNGKYYWGKDLLQLLNPEELEEQKNYISVSIKTEKGDKQRGTHYTSFLLKGYVHDRKPNTREQCPIMIPTNYDQTKFIYYPCLKELNINSILPPQEIFLMLSAWLAPKEEYVDNRENKEKIVAAGFDLKTSFRNM